MGKVVDFNMTKVSLYIHFMLPDIRMVSSFDHNLQSLVNELLPHCNGVLQVKFDVARNLSDDLKKLGLQKSAVLLSQEQVDKALSYNIWVEFKGDESQIEHVTSVLANLLASVSVEGTGIELVPIEIDGSTSVMPTFAQQIAEVSSLVFKNPVPNTPHGIGTFPLNKETHSATDYFDLSFASRMVVIDPPFKIDGVAYVTARGTAYVYGAVNAPLLLVDDDGRPILMAINQGVAETLHDTSAVHFDWVIVRVIMIPQIPNLNILSHCISNHPVIPGFGDCRYAYICPLGAMSEVTSMVSLMLAGYLFTGFSDANGVAFVDLYCPENRLIARLPMRDMHRYISSMEDIFSHKGSFHSSSLIEHAVGFIPSVDIYEPLKTIRH